MKSIGKSVVSFQLQRNRVFDSFLFILFHLVILGFHRHYKELSIADFSQHDSVSSPWPQIEILTLQCAIPKIDALKSVVNIEPTDVLFRSIFDEILCSAPNLNVDFI